MVVCLKNGICGLSLFPLGREKNINLPKQHRHVNWLRHVHGGRMTVGTMTGQREGTR